VPDGYEDFIPVNKPILSVAAIPAGSNGVGGTAMTVYDYRFDRNSCSWVPWMDQVPTLSIPAGAGFSDIMVPTKDTVRYARQRIC
jgi:dynein heavy chain